MENRYRQESSGVGSEGASEIADRYCQGIYRAGAYRFSLFLCRRRGARNAREGGKEGHRATHGAKG